MQQSVSLVARAVTAALLLSTSATVLATETDSLTDRAAKVC